MQLRPYLSMGPAASALVGLGGGAARTWSALIPTRRIVRLVSGVLVEVNKTMAVQDRCISHASMALILPPDGHGSFRPVGADRPASGGAGRRRDVP